jgi:hypothetical protein
LTLDDVDSLLYAAAGPVDDSEEVDKVETAVS